MGTQGSPLSGAEKIGEGRYRKVFRVGKLAVKVLKEKVRKDYGLFTMEYKTSSYTRYKFGIEDFNRYEYDFYNDFIGLIPDHSKGLFSKIHAAWHKGGKSYSISDLVLNSDGTLGKTLKGYGRVDDKYFWEKMDELEHMVLTKVPVMDISGENIIVREEDGGVAPVLIDYKRCGWKSYPFQPWLWSKACSIRKRERRFHRLREEHGPI